MQLFNKFTSSEGKNLLSFSTANTVSTPLFSIDLVSAPGPGPTSQTQPPFFKFATLTILPTRYVYHVSAAI